MNGRKQHIIVDSQGLLLDAVVHPADVQDREGAKLVFDKLSGRFPNLSLVWADGGCGGKLADWVRENSDGDDSPNAPPPDRITLLDTAS